MMQDVPKFVLRRLEESAGVGTHPDADLLTGFMEKSLLESERNRVMEHLARCSACRDTVALAVPASEDVAPIASMNPGRNSWLSWAARRWVVATVGIVAITSIGIRHYRLRTNETSDHILLSRNETTPSPSLAIPPPQASSDSLQIPPHAKNGERADSRRKAQPNRQEPFSSDPLDGLSNQQSRSPHGGRADAALGRGAGVASGSAGGRPPATAEPAAPSPSLGQETTVPSSSQTVEVESQAAAVTASSEKQVSHLSVNDQKSQPLTYQSSKNFVAVTARPRWSISSEGALQRSLDAGHTWVDVDPGQALKQSTSIGSNENAREFDKSGEKKIDAQSNPVFRAAIAFGNEVWAGGSAAMLYHSSDSGVHWARIVPSARGAMLTGNISSIDFSDPQHGAITTSTGEFWITADAGRTWRRK